MAKKLKVDDSTLSMFDGISEQVKTSKQKQREPEKPPFKKPVGDYYRLDMIVRETRTGAKGHPVITEDIKTNYKDYVATMAAAEGISITKYIHKILDMDMYVHKSDYKRIKKAQGQ